MVLVAVVWITRDRAEDKQIAPEATPAAFTFTNADNGEAITVTFNNEDETATLNGLDYVDLVFTQAISASGARYVNEETGLELWNKGDEISLSMGEERLFVGSTEVEASVTLDETGLSDHEWVWQETQMNDDEVITPNEAGAFTLTFDPAAGRVYGKTDCNGFSGGYTVEAEKTITFGPLASTMMYCEGSQEAEFSGMIASTSHFVFTEDGDLVLLLRDDSGLVVFTKK